MKDNMNINNGERNHYERMNEEMTNSDKYSNQSTK